MIHESPYSQDSPSSISTYVIMTFSTPHSWRKTFRYLQHMDAAVEHLKRECEGLRLRRNALRQEEIAEEIELILLSAEAFLGKPLKMT
jgi:hypothetical protein